MRSGKMLLLISPLFLNETSFSAGASVLSEESSKCMCFAEPTPADQPRVDHARSRGEAVGMPVTTTVVGLDPGQTREQRCLVGLATALRARSGSARGKHHGHNCDKIASLWTPTSQLRSGLRSPMAAALTVFPRVRAVDVYRVV